MFCEIIHANIDAQKTIVIPPTTTDPERAYATKSPTDELTATQRVSNVTCARRGLIIFVGVFSL